jgi:dUTP diphosphatase
MLKVKLLEPGAKLPTVGHPGEDLGYDLYALNDVVLIPGQATAVETGISAQFERDALVHGWVQMDRSKFGLLIKDRSSMAAKGVRTSAGVIDAGYTGELKVMMTATRDAYAIKAGDKIAQIVPQEVLTSALVIEVDELGQTSRGLGGFGSTGV